MATISGYIRNSDSNLGIPRVLVTLSGTQGNFSAYTDNNGYYIMNVPAGFYTLMIREREYEPVTEGVNIVGNIKKDIYIRRITFAL